MFLFAFVLPRDQFQIFGLENFDGPLCTGGCEKLVYMAEILVTLSVLREPARIFLNKMCSFDATDSEKTLLVTLYWYCKDNVFATDIDIGTVYTCILIL